MREKPVTDEEIRKVVEEVEKGCSDWIMLNSCLDHRSEAITKAVSKGFLVEDGAVLKLGRPFVEEKLEPTKPVKKLTPPTLPGCKCRNADQQNPLYWMFTGWEKDGILEVAKQLSSLGINVYLEQNGNNGNYRMKVPLYVTGSFIQNSQSIWKEIKEEEENNVSNNTESTESESTIGANQESICFISNDETEVYRSIA